MHRPAPQPRSLTLLQFPCSELFMPLWVASGVASLSCVTHFLGRLPGVATQLPLHTHKSDGPASSIGLFVCTDFHVRCSMARGGVSYALGTDLQCVSLQNWVKRRGMVVVTAVGSLCIAQLILVDCKVTGAATHTHTQLSKCHTHQSVQSPIRSPEHSELDTTACAIMGCHCHPTGQCPVVWHT